MKIVKTTLLAFCLAACHQGAANAMTFSADTILTPPADGLYSFSDLTISAGVRVSFAPVEGLTTIDWLVDGDAVIAGTLDLGGLYGFSLRAVNIRLEGSLINNGKSISLASTNKLMLDQDAAVRTGRINGMPEVGSVAGGSVELSAGADLSIRGTTRNDGSPTDLTLPGGRIVIDAQRNTPIEVINPDGQIDLASGAALQQLDSALLSAAPSIQPSIPEPETYAMLLAGLGLVGLAARRRKAGR